MPLTKATINVDVDLASIEDAIEDLQVEDIALNSAINSLISDVSDISEELESLGELGFTIPSTIKTTAAIGDYFIGVDSDGLLYKITKENLLAGLTGGGDTEEPSTDEFFSNVKLLLRAGSIGSQVVTDASNSENEIVVYGNTVVATGYFSESKGITFDGNGDYLLSPGDIDFSLGSGDFTLEALIKPTALTSANGRQIMGTYYSNAGNFGWLLYLSASTGNLSFFVGNSSGGTVVNIVGSAAPTVNAWNYVAATRVDGVITLTLNNSVVGTTTNSFNDTYVRSLKIGTQEAISVGIGASSTSFVGVIDENVRISKGIVRDVSSMPTAPFPAS